MSLGAPPSDIDASHLRSAWSCVSDDDTRFHKDVANLNALRAQSRLDRDKQRAQVASLYASGLAWREIAERLGVSHTTVGNNLAAIRARYREQAMQTTETHVADMLLKLDQLESRLVPLSLESRDPKTGLSAAAQLMSLFDRKAKLLGLDAAKRPQLSGRESPPIEISIEQAQVEKLAGVALCVPARPCCNRKNDA